MNQRRKIIQSTLAAVAVTAAPAMAQTSWPNRPLRLIVPTGPGSSLDLIARTINERLREKLGQPVVVDNKPGAGGLLGTDAVAKANDGHTFGISFNGPLAYAPFLYAKLPYRLPEDIAPIAITTSQPNVLAINTSLPVRNVKELVAYLRAKPGQVNFASIGNGSSSHLTMELFKFATQTFALHIPYNGSPPSAMATANNEVQMIMAVASAITPHVQSGRVRIIAVTSKERYSVLPEVPTIAESGLPELKDFEAIAWNGIIGPISTPADVITRFNSEINAALKDTSIVKKLNVAGLTALTGSPKDLANLMAAENKKWGPIIKRTGATLG